MKTYIINLDPHDDIISARDKMGWAKAERILLVWPERVRLLDRRLDLVLLQRHSAALGAQLGVISRDTEVRYHAPRLGILVFKDLRQAQRSNWRLPRRLRKPASLLTGQLAIEHGQNMPDKLHPGDSAGNFAVVEKWSRK